MITLIIGASASGKSEYAETVLKEYPENKYYIATMQPFGEEGELRVKKHKEQRRGKGFVTIEKYSRLCELALEQTSEVLLECVGNLVANELFLEDNSAKHAIINTVRGIMTLSEQCNNLVVVTNDIFSDGQSYDGETMRYISALASTNAEIAKQCDNVIEVVCGIPIAIKGVVL